MKVVVTGSLGNISQPLAKTLIQNGHAVMVISTNPGKQNDIRALGAIPAIGSLTDGDFLTSVLTGADALYAMIPPNFGAADSRVYYREIGNAYATAIQQSGIKRVVHLSSWGAHLSQGTGFILGSHDTEEILDRVPGISLTHLRPTSFFINLYHSLEMLRTAGIIGNNYGENKIAMVHPADIAAAAAEELAATPGSPVRYVCSGEYTGIETAAILGAAIGRPGLKWVVFTDEQMRQGMRERGTPEHIIDGFVELGASIRSGALRADYDLHKPEMGKLGLKDFAKEFAVVYGQK